MLLLNSIDRLELLVLLDRYGLDLVLVAPGEVIPGSHPMPGAPATQVFHFQAVGSGSTGLELDYVRPWEKGAAPSKAHLRRQ